MTGYWWALRAFDRSFWLYLGYRAILAFSYSGVLSVLLNLYLLRLGYGPEFIGLLVGSGQIVWATLALPAGAIGKRTGLREAQIAGLALSAIGVGSLLLVEALPGAVWEYWLFACWIVTWSKIFLPDWQTAQPYPILPGALMRRTTRRCAH